MLREMRRGKWAMVSEGDAERLRCRSVDVLSARGSIRMPIEYLIR
jgi:hypothetical protein